MKRPQPESDMLPRLFVSRSRLVRGLLEATRCKLTLLCAEAGYGKTTVAAEFACSVAARTAWCHISSADRDITRLAEMLGEALGRLAAKPEAKTARRASYRHGMPSVSVLTDTLLRRAAKIGPEPAFLFLDDYQNLDQEPDANLLLQSIIEGSPSSLHFVLLSRSEPQFPLARLRAGQELSVLGVEELAFSLEETSRFLREESGLDLEEEAIALIQERTEGWAAGIAMVAQSLSHGSQDKVMAVLADPATSAWLVYDYLAEEVFDRQPQATQDFLLRTSILHLLHAQVCNQFLGLSSSQAILLSLEAQGLFTTRLDLSRQTFRYHQLFREFLRQKLHQLESQESVRALHLQAAQIYEQGEVWEECVHHYLKAGEPVRACEAVEAFGGRHTLYGFHQSLQYWLKILPEDLTATRPWLLALKGQLNLLSGNFEEALRLVERASRLFDAAGDSRGQLWTAGELAYARFRVGHLQKSIAGFTAALQMAPSESRIKDWLVVNQAKAYREAGMLEAAEEACSASVLELERTGDEKGGARWRSRSFRILALVQMERGDLRAAKRSIEESLTICGGHEVGEHEEGWVHTAQGGVLWATGAFEEARQALARALSLHGQYSGYRRDLIALWLGNTLRDLGRYSEAQEAYGWGSAEAQVEALFLAALTGRGQAVRTAALGLYRQNYSSEMIPLRSSLEVVLGAVLRETSQAAEALEHLREGTRVLKAHGYRLRLASALLHQARLEYEMLRPSEARASLTQAFDLASTGHYYHFFWWDSDLVAFLCLKAIAEDLFPDYAGELMVRRLGRPSLGLLAPLLHDRRSQVRQRVRALLFCLPQEGGMSPQEEVLAECADLRVRAELSRALAEGLLSTEGVCRLRVKHGLSWRELEILVEYYLRPAAAPEKEATTLRKGCAQRLNISEDTVRRHVNNLRAKLALPVSVSGRHVLTWAEQEGLVPRPNPPSLPQHNLLGAINP